jgi:hypothetical protein
MPTTYLAKKNPHPRDTRIVFDEGPHTYTIKGEEDKQYTSVTTWVHSYFKKFDAKGVIQAMMRNKRKWDDPIANEKYYGKTAEEIEEMWKQSGQEAAAKGTAMHYEIECFYNRPPTEDPITSTAETAETTETTDPQSQPVVGGRTPPHHHSPVVGGRNPLQYFQNFNKEFVENGTLRPYRTEWTVFHEEAQIAGSIDMVYENTDSPEDARTLSIYDWKRCKEITKTNRGGEFATNPIIEHFPDTNYWHYALQLNIYKYILQTKYGKKITDLYLIVLHPDAKNYQRIKLPDIQAEVDELFKERIAATAATATAAVLRK